MFVVPVNISVAAPHVEHVQFALSPVEAAKAKLLQFLRAEHPNIDPEKVIAVSVESVVWNNGALGCPKEGRMYTQALVPGFRIQFQTEYGMYAMHTDQTGRQVASPDFP